MKKRTWVYTEKPITYDIQCDICGGTNITWSEWEHKIWCYDCLKDTRGTGGIFDGPIAFEIAELLGISFDRFYLKSKKVRKMKIIEDKIVWR